ncbi:sigma factor [Spongiactinospora gelatinilytica]
MELFETHRRHRWGVAYRILGTVADADDAMQETWPSAQTRTPSRTRGPV